jgi:MFS family permease
LAEDTHVGNLVRRVRRAPFWKPLAVRDLRLLWVGDSISILGDQFYFVALPWLTLQLTGSGLALGTVLMAAAVPRAVLMLVGGAVSDRFSPRAIMIVSNVLRALLMAAFTVLIIVDAIQLWHLYALSGLFGVVDAFFFPAIFSTVPKLVEKDQLEASNALLQSTGQLMMLVGPAPAGVLAATVSLAAVFGIGAAAFVIAALIIRLMAEGDLGGPVRQQGEEDAADEPADSAGLLADVMEGLRYAWNDPAIRAIVILLAALDTAFYGPIDVGLVSLADRRFVGGSKAFGIMLSAHGGGALLGALLGGSIKRPRRLGPLLLLYIPGVLGVGLALLGLASHILVAVALLAVMGVVGGVYGVMVITWLQARAEPDMVGRLMSLVMLASYGAAPFSFVMAGALVDRGISLMYGVAGGILLITTAIASTSRTVRTLE